MFRPIHGHTSDGKTSKVYQAWHDMKRRCLNPNAPDYQNYGGRGITVCERWKTFANFLADMGEPPAGMSLDRINNDGNYEPGNCRWATTLQQVRNSRASRLLTLNGETLPRSAWEQKLGLGSGTITRRLAKGMPLQQALQPIRRPV
jgi:pentatricopeptide repeat protein